MGTSTSSKGPLGNVPLIPAWVSPVEPIQDETEFTQPDLLLPFADDPVPSNIIPFPTLELAPMRRFAGARTKLGHFAKTGERESLKRGVAHYVKGMGGATTAAHRMGRTAQTVAALWNTLNAIQNNDTALQVLNIDSLQGYSTEDICDKIIDVISPLDGILDAELSRKSLGCAMRDLLTMHPDVDLQKLTLSQINLLIERYIANDIFQRLELDVGRSVMASAPTPTHGIQRLEEIRNYIQSGVTSCLQDLYTNGKSISQQNAESFAARILEDTYYIFEEFIR